MYRLRVRDHFDAAHHIRDYVGKCSRVHGHRWVVEVCLSSISLDSLHMITDFANVKAMMNELLSSTLDHFDLNQQLGDIPNVTAELLAEWVYDRLKERFTRVEWVRGLQLDYVEIWESPDCGVRYDGEA